MDIARKVTCLLVVVICLSCAAIAATRSPAARLHCHLNRLNKPAVERIQDDPFTPKVESQSFEFNMCEAVASWEQVQNSTPIFTKEYIDALPNGWEEYALPKTDLQENWRI